MHGAGPIFTGALGDHPGIRHIAHQSNRLARNTHANFEFRTYGNPLDMKTKRFRQKTVSFIAAVIPDLLPKQTSADADPGFREKESSIGGVYYL